MSMDAQKLYELLPAIYRIRDAENGEPLKALLSVIAEQIVALEEDLAQLYDDQFIETCAEWVVPYIGDLIGYRQLYGLTSQVRSPRAEVANAIRLRRRKGTAAVLKELAQDVTGWNAEVVEFFQRLATTQCMNHVRPENLAAPDLRRWEPLERLDGPFDSLSRTVDVRSVTSGRGRYNIANVGLYLWRLRGYSLTGSPAFRLDDRRYLFSPLGTSVPLFGRSQGEFEQAPSAPLIDAPMPISRRTLDKHRQDLYGANKSLFIEGVPLDQILICNLSDAAGGAWAHVAPAGKVAIDPVLGRIAYGTAPAAPPSVTYHYGFSADMGGGEYDRLDSLEMTLQPIARTPSPNATIQQALNAVAAAGGAVEIGNSGRYAETPSIAVTSTGKQVELRAANDTRPVLTLGGALRVSGAEGSEVSLNGLLISGGSLQVTPTGDGQRLRRLKLSHLTLVPGIALAANGAPQQPNAASLVVNTPGTIVEIDHCILGGLRVVEGAEVRITNSIVDATSESGVAYAAIDARSGGAPLRIENSTVIGKVHTVMMTLASNSIFLARLMDGDRWLAPMWVDRRQDGCVRFSYLPPGSRTPRRYRCQPAADAEAARIRPVFSSLRYGNPGYCQLSGRSALEVVQGAEDAAEMGVFHDLYQSQRQTNLKVRLNEYLRFGMEAGFVFVN
jgi:Phage tail protein (Tail_P2_I)